MPQDVTRILTSVKTRNDYSAGKIFHAQQAMTEKPYKDVGDRLRWHRETLGLRQVDYAAAIGQKRAVYSLWETGTTQITLPNGERLADLYGISLDWLYRGDAGALPQALRNEYLDWLRKKDGEKDQ